MAEGEVIGETDGDPLATTHWRRNRRREVEIAVCGDGECIWPENPRIVRDGFPLSVSLALADAIALIVAGVDATLVADSF